MESNRKRKVGFMKGKLMPFYRTSSKPNSSNNVQYLSSKVKPINPPSQTNYVVHHQDYIFASPKPKVSFVLPPPTAAEHGSRHDKYLAQVDKLFGGVAADESVDIKAATYISSVQERFKLERAYSERVKHEDMAVTN